MHCFMQLIQRKPAGRFETFTTVNYLSIKTISYRRKKRRKLILHWPEPLLGNSIYILFPIRVPARTYIYIASGPAHIDNTFLSPLL